MIKHHDFLKLRLICLLTSLMLIVGTSVVAQDATPTTPLEEAPTFTPVDLPIETPTDIPQVESSPTDIPPTNIPTEPALDLTAPVPSPEPPSASLTPSPTPLVDSVPGMVETLIPPTSEASAVNVPLSLPGSEEPLVAPTNVQAVSDGTNITITWVDTNSSEIRYEIERQEAYSFLGTAPIDATSFADNNLPCGLTFWYRVRAVHSLYNGPWSEWVSVTTTPCTPFCNSTASIHRVSVGTNGEYQSNDLRWGSATLSHDGRYAFFSSIVPLTGDRDQEIAVESNDAADIYRYDTQTCTTIKVSLGVDNVETLQNVFMGAISPDGSLAAFSVGYVDASAVYQSVFLRNIAQGTTTAIPLAGNVRDITPDGRYLLVDVMAPLTDITDTNNASDVVLYDTQTNTQIPISVDYAGTATSNNRSYGMRIFVVNSKLYVIYDSWGSNIVDAYNPNLTHDIYLRNVTDSKTTLLSVRDDETRFVSQLTIYDAAQKDNGLTVTFGYHESWVGGHGTQTYARTVNLDTPELGETRIVSRTSGLNGAYAATGSGGKLSETGRWLVFTAQDGDLAPQDPAGPALYVRDLFTFTTRRILSLPLLDAAKFTNLVNISGDGSRILVYSYRPDLVPNDTNNACQQDWNDWPELPPQDYNDNCADYFTVPNPLYSAEAAPATATVTLTPSMTPTITSTPSPTTIATLDGSTTPTATLNPGPYVCGALTGIWPISVTLGDQDAKTLVTKRAISEDGRYIIFSSDTPFSAPYSDYDEYAPQYDVYRYDTETCSISKISVKSNGTDTPYHAYAGYISDYGDQVAYSVADYSGYELKFFADVRTISAQTGNSTVRSPWYSYKENTPGDSFTNFLQDQSGDGRYLLYYTFNRLNVFDRITHDDYVATQLENGQGWTSIKGKHLRGKLISRQGDVYAIFSSADNGIVTGQINDMLTNVFVRNVIDEYTVQLDLSSAGIVGDASSEAVDAVIFDTNLYVLFYSSATNLTEDDVTGQALYLRVSPLNNLSTGTTTLVSRPTVINGTLNVNAENGYLSRNGRWVVWDSLDAQVVPNDTNNQRDVFVRDLQTGTTQRVSVGANGDQLPDFSWARGFSPDGRYVLVGTGNSLHSADYDLLCETDQQTPYDYNEMCEDLYLFPNPLHPLPYPVLLTLTPSATPTLTESPTLTATSTGTITATFTATSTPTPTATLTPPPAPILSEPADGALLNTLIPTFRWEGSGTAYHIQLSWEETFTAPFADVVTDEVYAPSQPLNMGVYYWRVKEIGPVNSDWSATRSFTIDVALLPAPDSMVIGANLVTPVTFGWTNTLNFAGFSVQIATDVAFTSLYATCTTPNTSSPLTTCTQSLPANTYYWRMTRYSSPSSLIRKLIVSPPAPPALDQLLPANNGVTGQALTWSWATSPTVEGPFTYDVEISTKSNFSDVVAENGFGLTDNVYPLAAIAEGRYFWRVRAVNKYGLPGTWSTGTLFQLDRTPPPAPVVLGPDDGTVFSTSLAVRWQPQGTLVRVRLNPALDTCEADYTRLYPTTNPSTSTLTITDRDQPQGTYRVCVQAFDAAENVSAWSAGPRVTLFLGTRPLDGAFIAPTVRPVFGWTAATYAAGTQLRMQVDNEPTFASPLVHESSLLPGTASSYTLPTTLPQGAYYWRVIRVMNGTPESLNGQVWRRFYVGALGTAPALTGPALGALINTSTALTWNAAQAPTATQITHYEVVISTNAAFNTTMARALVDANDLLNYAFTPVANQNRVTHYWRVRGLNDGNPITQWSTRTFIVDNVAPPMPTVTSPVVNSLINTVRPSFVWLAVPGAVRYEVGINSLTAASPVVVPDTSVNTTSFVPTPVLPQDLLTFRVRAFDGMNWSAWQTVTFSVRLGTSPAQNAFVATNRPTFSWAPVPGANSYTLQIDDDVSFETGGANTPFLLTIPLGNVFTYTLKSNEPLPGNGVYRWRVMADILPYPQNTTSRTFYVAAAAGAKPTNLAARVNGITGTVDTLFGAHEDDPIGLTWNAVTPAPLYYDVQISTSSSFTTAGTMVLAAQEPAAQINSGTLTDGVKYWRVRAVYSADMTGVGPWSDPRGFTLDTQNPLPPMSSAPLSSTTKTARPVFTWSAVPGATQYRLTVMSGLTGEPVPSLNDVVVRTTSYTLPTTRPALLQDTTAGYTWSVVAEDLAGNRSSGFVARTLFVFVGSTPTANQFLVDSTPTFTWTGVSGSGAAQWTLQIARDAAMTQLVYTSPLLAASSTSFTLPNLNPLQPGRYMWRVTRANEIRDAVHGSSFWIVKNMVGAAPRPLTPANNTWINADVLSSGLTLTWQPVDPNVAGVVPEGTRVEISTSSAFGTGSIVVTQTVFDAESLVVTQPLVDGVYYWRLSGVYANGDLGPVSTVNSFKVDKTPPDAPALIQPVSNAIITDNTPTLTWAAASGAPVEYILQIEPDPQSLGPTYTAVIKAPALTHTLPNASALSNGRYIWRVLAKDTAGNVSAGTNGRLLIIAAP